MRSSVKISGTKVFNCVLKILVFHLKSIASRYSATRFFAYYIDGGTDDRCCIGLRFSKKPIQGNVDMKPTLHIPAGGQNSSSFLIYNSN